MTTEQLLVRTQDGPLLVATLNRPGKANAINRPLLDAIDQLAADLETDRSAPPVRALILVGADGAAFSAGADITELADLNADTARALMRRGQAVFDRIERLSIPVIAAINGAALGGGLELAMAADLRIASPDARLGQPEITLANLPGWGGTQRLPQLVGRGRASELILTGEPIDAQRGYQIGLVDRLADDPLAEAIRLAKTLAEHSPAALAGAKHAIRVGLEEGCDAGLRAEADAVTICCQSPEQHAAVRAFLTRSRR